MSEPIRKESPPQQPKAEMLEPRPLLNYTLSTVCPACQSPTYRAACKVRCPRCGFMWDCSEL
jgi:transposase